MRIDPKERLVALNVALVAAQLAHAELFCTAMATLMQVPERLPSLPSLDARQTGGRVDPKKNTASKVMSDLLNAAIAQSEWAFELCLTALTPSGSEAFKKTAEAALKKAKADEVRLTIDTFVLVDPTTAGSTDPSVYLHPLLTACGQRLLPVRKQLQAR